MCEAIMPINVVCESCNAQLKLKEELAGKKIKCPKCGGVTRVTAQAPAGAAVSKPGSLAAKPGPEKSADQAESLRLECPECDHRFKVPSSKAGKKVRCPECEHVFPAPPPPSEQDDDEETDEDAPPKRRRPRDDDDDEPRDRRRRDEDEDDDDDPKAKRRRNRDEDDDEDDRKPAKGKKKRRGNDAWRESPLWDHDRMTIKAKYSLFWFIGRTYWVNNPDTKKALCDATEVVPWWKMLGRMFGLKHFMSTEIEVADLKEGPRLFVVRKLATFFAFIRAPLAFVSTVEICDDEGEMFCYFRSKLLSLGGGFWIYDAKDRKIAEGKATLSPPSLGLKTVDGDVIGKITSEMYDMKPGQRVKLSIGLQIGAYVVTLAEDLEDPEDSKRLLLAAALAMELTGVGKFLLRNDK